MTDLLIAGGSVVTAGRTLLADVAISDGRVEAIGPDLAQAANETVDANGMLVLPGCVDVHTHTRLPTDDEPDRFYQDSVAAAYGGTTTFLAFNNPGTGISEEGSSSPLRGLAEFRARTDGESVVDYSLSAVITGQQTDALSELPALIDAGVPSFKAFMVYDFRLTDDRLFATMRIAGRHGGLLQVHCENATIVDELVRRELEADHTACRYHASSRPSYAEAEATHRAIALARAADAPVYIVHLSCAEALAEVAAAKAAGLPVYAETCPHYLTLTQERYEAPEEAEVIRCLISPPLRSNADRDALWMGLAAGGLDVVASDHVPDRLDREKRIPAPPFPEVSNGAPGIETLLSVVYSEGVGGGRIGVERMVEVLASGPARLFGLPRKGAIEVGKDADLVVFDPGGRRSLRASELHHTSDFTPYEGMQVRGAIRHVLSRGRWVIRDRQLQAERGGGRFLGRVPIG